MSILDEDESNFANSGERYEYNSKVIKKHISDAKILVSKCHGISCYKCVGRKYNLRNGCPICGNTAAISSQRYYCIYSIDRCKECGSIIMSCGDGNIYAVGVPKIWLELSAKEDTI